MDSVNREELDSLMAKFGEARVLVVGDVMVDEYVWGHVGRISPEAPVPVVEVRRENWVSGGAANVAANLSTLGVSAELAGVVGDDSTGRDLVAEMAAQGIGTSLMTTDPDRPTTAAARLGRLVVVSGRQCPHPASARR